MRRKRHSLLVIWMVASALALAAVETNAASDKGDKSARVLREMPVTAQDERLAIASNSPQVVADPRNPQVLALANRTDNPDFGCRLHVSGDAGRGWLPAPVVQILPTGAEKCYAPEVAFDAQGRLNYLFVGLAGVGNNPSGAYLVKSTDDGYTRPRRVLGPERYMVRMAIDPERGSQGRMHLVWLEAGQDPPIGGLALGDNPIMSAYSDDGGKTFSKPVRVTSTRRLAVAPSLALGPDGSVHVLFYDLRDDVRDYQGLEGPVWEGNWALVMASSGDGGNRFGSEVVVDHALVPPERVMLIYTMPPPALAADSKGRLFAAWHDARNGDWDVFLRRSVDGGKTWGRAKRLNDDPMNNGRHQSLPRLAVAPNDRLDAIFYDRRDDPKNQRHHLYFTSSHNAGAAFSPNIKVTSDSSDSMVGPRYPIPSATGLVEFGSRLGLLSTEAGAVAAWTDNRNSSPETYQQDIFATQVRLRGTQGSSIGPAVLSGTALAALLVFGAGLVSFLKRRREAP